MSSRAEEFFKKKCGGKDALEADRSRCYFSNHSVVLLLDQYAEELLKEQQEKIEQLQKDLELSDFMCQQAVDKGIELMRKIELLEKEIAELRKPVVICGEPLRCEHLYSRTMNQECPRKCTRCGEIEKPHKPTNQ